MSRHESTTFRIRDLFYGSVIAVSIACTGSLISLLGTAGTGGSVAMATPLAFEMSGVRPASTTSATFTGGANLAASTDAADLAPTPVSAHGALSVQGAGLVDASGEPFQLRGISSHGLTWLEDYVGSPALEKETEDWGANSLRFELYTGENGGHVNGDTPADLLDQVNVGVNAATREGLYAIIDWHVLNNGNPLSNVDEARAFFSKVSERYGAQGNVLYEICNESASSVPWSDVKAYAEDVIGAIRANDPDAVVIVGAPAGASTTSLSEQPLSDTAGENVLYGIDSNQMVSAGQGLDERLEAVIASGLPVYVSEFGDPESALATSDEGGTWLDRAEAENVSFACGSLSDRDEAAALAENGALAGSQHDVFDSESYNDSGTWDRACLRDTLGLV